MKFKAYNKIHALHKAECIGILEGTCYIQEKIDGANASIWLDEDGIHCGSRTRDLTAANDDFNGFATYVKEHSGISVFFKHYPTHRLYGEWLVRHTIGYDELSYKQFYLFDIEDENGDFMSIDEVYDLARQCDIPTAKLFGKIENPSLDDIKKFAGKSELGAKGEGVVIKNENFINAFGNKQYAKYVTDDFKEDNAITFGGNNKHSETYNEMYYMNKFMTLSRVQKIFHKLESIEGRLEMKHVPRVMEMAYYDLITEECWTIVKDMSKQGKLFDFKKFGTLCTRKAKQIFIELLNNDISVNHK